MNKDATLLQQMFAERLIADAKAREAYSQLSGTPSEMFDDAVKIVTERLSVTSRNQSSGVGIEFMEGIIEFNKYLPRGSNEADLAILIEQSKTDWYALQVLRLVEQMTPREAQPERLLKWSRQLYLGLVSQPPKPRGASRNANTHRNFLIVSEIKRLQEVGFAATRNVASEPVSACDVIQAALTRLGRTIDISAVVAIWKRRDAISRLGMPEVYTSDIIKKILSEKKPK